MRSSGIQLRVGDILFSIQKRWKLIVALTFVGLVFGLLLSGMTYVQSGLQSFEATGSFVINTYTNGYYLSGLHEPAYNDFMMPPEMVDAVTYVVTSDRVLDAVINEQNILGMSPAALRKVLSLTQFNATQIVEMKLNWYNPEEGIAIWHAIVDVSNSVLPETLQVGSLAVLNEPVAQMVGATGSDGTLWVVLTVLGFMAGVGFAVMELLMHPTLTNIKDIETLFGMETLSIIPRDNEYFRNKTQMLVQEDGGAAITQSFSAAAYILRNRLGTKEAHHCFYVTSAIALEGKTTVAANLAIQLSDMERRTLLIDFDTRNPRLGSLFLSQMDYNRSLNALYRGDATEQDAIITLTGYLDILPALLGSYAISMDSTIVELFDRLKQKYEYIVIDAPPVGEVSDTLSLNQVANTAVFVVGYDMATIPEIQNSLEKLDKTGVRICGCIVNAAPTAGGKGVGKDSNKETKKRKKKKAAESDSAAEKESEYQTLLQNREKTDAKPEEGDQKKERRLKKHKAKAEEASPTPERTEPPKQRNTLEDLMEKSGPDGGMNDQQMMDELMKLGIAGEFGQDKGGEKDKPAEPKS